MKKKLHQKTYFILMVSALILIAVCWFYYQQPKEEINPPYRTDFRHLDSLLVSDTKKVETHAQSILSDARKSNTTRGLDYYYYYKLKIDLKKGQLDSIAYFIEKGLREATDKDNVELLSYINKTAGYHYLKNFDFVKSLNYLQHALANQQIHPNKENLADIYMAMAGVYFYLDNLEQSTHYCNLSYKIFHESKNKKGKASIYINMATLYFVKGQNDKAEAYLNQSMRLSEELKDTAKIVSNLNVLSALEVDKQNTKKALAYLSTAYTLAIQAKMRDHESDILYKYGQVYESMEEYDKAKKYFNKVRDLKATDTLRNQIITLESLARIAEKQGHFQESNTYLKEFHTLNKLTKGAQVIEKTEATKWESLLREQALQQEIAEQNYKIQIYVYVFCTISALLSIALIWYMYNSKSKSLQISQLENKNLGKKVQLEKKLKQIQETKHHNELALMNRELTALNIQILSKNNFVGEIKEIIEGKNKSENSDNTLIQLKHSIHKMSNVDKNWDQFQKVFQKIHPDFFNFIQFNYPEISKTELRICAYIKINMANNEMSTLLNISHKSLITNRYRIRKKLHLDPTQDLDEIIQSW